MVEIKAIFYEPSETFPAGFTDLVVESTGIPWIKTEYRLPSYSVASGSLDEYRDALVSVERNLSDAIEVVRQAMESLPLPNCPF